MGNRQNYGPFLGPSYNTGPNTGPNLGDPKRDHNFYSSPYVHSMGCLVWDGIEINIGYTFLILVVKGLSSLTRTQFQVLCGFQNGTSHEVGG